MQAFEPVQISPDEKRRSFYVFVPQDHEVRRIDQYVRGLVSNMRIADFQLDTPIVSDDRASDWQEAMQAR